MFALGPLGWGGSDWKKAGQFMFGQGPRMEKMKTLNSGQKNYLNDILKQLLGQNINLEQSPLYQQGSNYLQDLMNPEGQQYQSFSKPMMREFNEQIMPGIAEQFAGVGGLSSSGFQNAAAGAGAGLAERLQALRSGLQMQGVGQALGYAQAPAQQSMGFGQLGLGTPAFGYKNFPQRQGAFGDIARLGMAAGGMM